MAWTLPEDLIREVRAIFDGDASGHDYFHTERVLHMAERLAQEEGADSRIVCLAALLHDVDDRKLPGGDPEHLTRARALMDRFGVDAGTAERVCAAIRQVSFKGTDSVTPDTLEACIVQDADRLDAIGAVGIGRAFAFGGSRGRKMYDPAEPPSLGMNAAAYAKNQGHTINHFYEKLLLLKDLMNTGSAKRIAESRHQYMAAFLEEFLQEWNGDR